MEATTNPHVTRYLPVPRAPGALDLAGLPVHRVDPAQTLDFLAQTIASGRQAVVLHLNVFAANLASFRFRKYAIGESGNAFPNRH